MYLVGVGVAWEVDAVDGVGGMIWHVGSVRRVSEGGTLLISVASVGRSDYEVEEQVERFKIVHVSIDSRYPHTYYSMPADTNRSKDATKQLPVPKTPPTYQSSDNHNLAVNKPVRSSSCCSNRPFGPPRLPSLHSMNSSLSSSLSQPAAAVVESSFLTF